MLQCNDDRVAHDARPGAWRLSLSKLGIDRGICKSMISCGLPLGFQSAAYSISNVLIQVSVNSFGADVTTAWGLSGLRMALSGW